MLSISIPKRVKTFDILNPQVYKFLIFSVLPIGIIKDLSKLHRRPEKGAKCAMLQSRPEVTKQT